MIDIRLSDNLELMAEMQDNTVDLIYCDILYGTGRKFKDYQDLKPIRSVIENHYIPRIKEMYRILKDTGSIYLQMDTKVNHWIRCILDDVFNYSNFQNEISWHYKGTGTSKTFVKKHDVILLYTKTKNFKHNTIYVASAKKTGWTGKNEKRCDDVWSDINTIFQSKERGTQVYNTQKPKALIERIIKASSNEGDLVADFYLGSGTTAEVCKDLKRNFIGCDISPKAIELTNKRLS
jgi:site-specific DNA-methyltransferase (adenine-specific)